MSAMLHEHVYLVQIEIGRFLVSVDVGRSELEVTDFPSVAKHFNYQEADRATQRMRRRGFRQAVVCSHLGVPVTGDDLRAALLAEAEYRDEEKLPRDKSELDRLPSSEIKRRWRRDAAFRARVDEIESM